LSLPRERAIALIFDGAGNLWLRSSRHLARIDRTHHKLVQDVVAAANEEGGKPSLDHNSGLLVPTTAGLSWRDHGRWRVISEKDGLSSNLVQIALEDSEGTLWVGGYGTGLDHLTGTRDWSAWTKSEGLPDNATWSTERDRKGRLWVSTTHGIAVWCRKRWKTLTTREGLAGNETRQLALARDGSIWAIALPGGITRIDPATYRTQRIPSFQGESFIFLIADGKGDIWATTRKNLIRFDGEKASPRAVQFPLPSDAEGQIWYLDFSPGGVMWATGRDRLLRFDGHHWRVFTRQDGLLGTTITSLAATADDEVWLGYDDVVGITRIKLDSARQVETEQYPWDVNIIGKDSQRRIWLNGIDGISVFTRGGQTLHFSQAEGLIWDDLSPYGFREESDGSFLISTTRGLAHYVPHSLAAPLASPDVLITSVSLGKQNESVSSHPRVDYDEGRFYAQFTPLLLNHSSNVTCRYRLAGLESSYVESNLREAVYAHLPAGSYEFDVQCRRDLLPWSPNVARFSFTVLPPWWQTIWFKAVGGLAAGLLIWLIVRARTNSLDRRRRELELAVAERSAELMQKNDELEEISLTDPLTHARNRRYLYEMIPADAAHVLRHYRGFTVPEKRDPVIKELIFAMVDIDFFKFANDEHGHMAGDQLIQEIAARLSDLIRKSDVLVRWGGEEFLIVCRSTDRHHAALLCSRILEAVSARPYRLDKGAEVFLTCSVGWAPFPWIPEAPDALTFEQVIEIADRALYVAKRTGRNHGVGFVPTHEALRAPYDIRLESLRTSSPATADIIRTENPCGAKLRTKAASATGSAPEPE
jgi:diguanylate cyclase (GGDEF)-like protein